MEISSGDATPRSAHAARAATTFPSEMCNAAAARGHVDARQSVRPARVKHAARRAGLRGREHQDVSREVRRGDGAPELVLVENRLDVWPSQRLGDEFEKQRPFDGRERRLRPGDDGAAKHDRLRVRPRFARHPLRRQLAAPVRVHGRDVRAVPLEVVFRVAGVHLVGGEVHEQRLLRGRVLARVPARYRREPLAKRHEQMFRDVRRVRGIGVLLARARRADRRAVHDDIQASGAQRRVDGFAHASARGDVRDVANARLAHVGQGVRGVRVVDALVPGVEHRTDHELTEVPAPAHDERAHGGGRRARGGLRRNR